MKKVLLGVFIALVAAATVVLAFQTPSSGASSKPPAQQKAEPAGPPPPKDAELQIKQDGDSCSLSHAPGPVYTPPRNGVITWTVKGSCNGKISIEKVTPQGGPFKTDGPKLARNGTQLHLYVTGNVNGRWTYDVFFEGKPIERSYHNLRDDDFALYCCPEWPCQSSVKPPDHPAH